jgi:hypothetical protein
MGIVDWIEANKLLAETEKPNAVYINSKGIPDVDMSKICSCSATSMDYCEENCGRYYWCNSILEAEDMLKAAGFE